jgi:hypothetical protein
MAIDIIATPNAADSNSFATLAEYAFYHARRLPLDPPVVVTGDVAENSPLGRTGKSLLLHVAYVDGRGGYHFSSSRLGPNWYV